LAPWRLLPYGRTGAWLAKVSWLPKEPRKEVLFMSWKSPKVVEIALGAEINSYACADAKK
jgi:coenzyme PQQ precursor peptide PqqA